jgi:type VI secretion system protein ImpL
MLRYVIAINVFILLWAGVVLFKLPVAVALLGTLLIAGTLGALFALKRMQASKGSRDIEKALSAQAEAFSREVRPDHQVEIEEMRKQFGQQLGALKTSKLGGGGQAALYALPWYMIVGPPGGGKSTALRNSGLSFPNKGRAVKGIGGTRNCDWWLTNEAILLDTAGRYATGDEDRDEWFAFLDSLKKARQKKPINGLIVAASVTDLGGHSEEHVRALAQKIRGRMDEVLGRLQVVVPVYVLFTKCDLIPGFVETFGAMNKQERGQVWGVTFPVDGAQKASEQFGEALDELTGVLWHYCYKRMGDERKLTVRDAVYELPQQFQELREALASFVDELFHGDVYHEAPMLRGAYLSSGTQEGRPMDLLRSSMASAFGVVRSFATHVTTEGKSYFLRDLFAKTIFPDQVLARKSQQGRREVLLRRAGIAGASALSALLLTILPLQSFRENAAMV